VIRSNVGKHGILPHIRRRRPKTGIQGGLFHFLLTQKCVKLCYQSIGIRAVHLTSIGDRLASGVGATKAMHTDLKEKLCSLYVEIQNIANQSILRYFHGAFLSFLHFFGLFYHKAKSGVKIFSDFFKKLFTFFLKYAILYDWKNIAHRFLPK
jgi:hypothetical protein